MFKWITEGKHRYTGPLKAFALLGPAGLPDNGGHCIVLVGLAHDPGYLNRSAHRVRMEMTPEEAEDLAHHLLSEARLAKAKSNGR